MPKVSFSGVPAAIRPKAAAALMRVVHTAEDLTHQSKAARYNTRGLPESAYVTSLGTLTEGTAHAIVDTLVARVQVLAEPVNYTLEAVVQGSVLTPFPMGLQDAAEITQQIGNGWAALAELGAEQAAALRSMGDSVSAHILEHQIIALEAASAQLQEIVGAQDPMEAVETAVVLGQ